MNPIIIILLIGMVAIIIGIFLYLKKKTNQLKQEINKSKIELHDLIEEIEKKKDFLDYIQDQTFKAQKENYQIEAHVKVLESNLNSINTEISSKHNELKSLEETYQKQLSDKKDALKIELDTSRDKQVSEMDKELAAYQFEIQEKKKLITDEYIKEKKNFDDILQDYRSKRESIIKISKEEEEMRENAKFYTLYISPSDVADIEILERVKPSLSRPDILSKLIYKTYYEKPYTDLVGRVIGNNKKITGIYKITNLINNKVYIGQAVDIAERWRQHIKRAVGAEPMTTNKLYPIMQETGPYNFSWQVVEECKKEELTAKEKYWIQFYDGQGYGYNIKG